MEFGAEAEIPMHRTASVDYGIIIKGKLEAIMEGGESRLLEKRDVIVQRGTVHDWKNPSKTQWCRALFVVV